jgi:hypothetical protein
VELTVEEPVLVAGDANGDGVFNFSDIEQVVAGGKFETGEPATWALGDWNKDGLFTFEDVLQALATGEYEDSSAGLLAAMSGAAVSEQPASASVADEAPTKVADPLPLPAEATEHEEVVRRSDDVAVGNTADAGGAGPAALGTSASRAVAATDQGTTSMPDDATEASVVRAKQVIAMHGPSAIRVGKRPIKRLRVGERSDEVAPRVQDGDDTGRRGGESYSLRLEAKRLRRARVVPADAVFRKLGERPFCRRPARLLRWSDRIHSSRWHVARRSWSGPRVDPVFDVSPTRSPPAAEK